MKRRNSQKRAQPVVRGFEYLIHRAISISLLFVLALLPLAPAFASEEPTEADSSSSAPSAEDSAPAVEEATSDPLEEEPLEEAPPEAVPESGEAEEEANSIDGNSTEPTTIEEPLPSVGEEDVLITEDSHVSSTPDSEILPDSEVITEPSTEEDIHSETGDEEVPEENEHKDTEKLEDLEEQSHEEVIAVNTVTNDENRFTFNKHECVSVGEGSYYCSDDEVHDVWEGTDRVFSEVDEEGDKEIFIEKDGKQVALTNNSVDDEAPYYDERSNSMVWQRLIDGRYQIVSFDLKKEEEKILTSDRYNNMEPSRYGDLTVWQGWVGDDWEIMLDRDGKTTMLTDNTYHDIAPRINGDYIMWQSFEEGEWRVKVYDVVTKHTETIETTDGASVENPRFVLVYDAKHANGDIETKGYDPLTKEVVPLNAKPAPIPEELPDPDQTGEDRALLQAATQLKPKNEGEPEPEPIEPELDNDNPDTLGSGEDLVIQPYPSGIPPEVIAPEVEAEVLVVQPLETESSTVFTEHIEDVVVSPYVSPGETGVDSQTGVASAQ